MNKNQHFNLQMTQMSVKKFIFVKKVIPTFRNKQIKIYGNQISHKTKHLMSNTFTKFLILSVKQTFLCHI